MAKLSIVILAVIFAAVSAFAPSSKVRTAASTSVAFLPKQQAVVDPMQLNMVEDMYWEEEYPPSKVLGPIMSKMPSGLLGILSIVFLAGCGYSLFQSSILVQEPNALANGSWVKWYYILGSFGGPLAWGTHVACWIQRKNGM